MLSSGNEEWKIYLLKAMLQIGKIAIANLKEIFQKKARSSIARDR
jgi:hypothetical protein